jgi:hypothetical protein
MNKGHPKSVVWKYVNETMDKFACKHCGTLLCKNSRKIKDHMIKVCKKCPTYVKKTLEEENNKLSYNKTQKTQNTIEIIPNERTMPIHAPLRRKLPLLLPLVSPIWRCSFPLLFLIPVAC